MLTQDNANILWTLIAAVLVFFMQAGFAMVESGFTRAKNSVNILMKNLLDFSAGSIIFFLIGFGFMFGDSGGFIGTSNFFGNIANAANSDGFNFAFLIFQTVFAATAATIVSGAVAERTKFKAYIIISIVATAIIYPISGSWAWGGLFKGAGWLENMGFLDFAGSTVVHSVGGWIGLAGAVVLGPRIGKYDKLGKKKLIAGHNVPLAALGVFILWFGWFGFNPGSTTTAGPEIASIAVVTNLAAAAAVLSALVVSWIVFKKADPGMSLNGALAGLVAITAGCDGVTPGGAIIIGLVAGVLVVFSVLFFDKIKVDDPVGAVSVHGVNGVWGTLAVGLFNTDSGLFYGGGIGQFMIQLTGAAAFFVWAFGAGLILFIIIKKTIGIRVERKEELQGLDINEHGVEAYGGFQIMP